MCDRATPDHRDTDRRRHHGRSSDGDLPAHRRTDVANRNCHDVAEWHPDSDAPDDSPADSVAQRDGHNYGDTHADTDRAADGFTDGSRYTDVDHECDRHSHTHRDHRDAHHQSQRITQPLGHGHGKGGHAADDSPTRSRGSHIDGNGNGDQTTNSRGDQRLPRTRPWPCR